MYTSLITLPWSFKILYGLITDNVKLCGLKRKPYLIIFALIQTIGMFTLFFMDYDSALAVALILMLVSLSNAFSNVVVDAILVVQARRDPEMGSQDLLSIAFLFQGIAGVIGCIAAAIMMENVHPKWAYLAYGIVGLIVAVCCIFLSKEAEKEYNEGEIIEITEWSSALEEGQTPSQAAAARKAIEDARPPRGEEGFCFNFKKNMRQIGWALKRKEIYFVVIYFILDGLTNPSFSDFAYFWLLNVVGVSKFMFAMIVLIGQICSVIGVIIYE